MCEQQIKPDIKCPAAPLSCRASSVVFVLLVFALMPLTLLVFGLAGPVCEVEAECSWTGLEVKEAIE